MLPVSSSSIFVIGADNNAHHLNMEQLGYNLRGELVFNFVMIYGLLIVRDVGRLLMLNESHRGYFIDWKIIV